MLLVILVASLVLPSILPSVLAFPVHLIIQPIPSVSSSVSPNVDAIACDLVVLPAAIVVAAIFPKVLSFPILLALTIHSFVLAAVNPSLHAVAVLIVLYPLSIVSGSIVVNINPFSISLVIPPFPLIDVPIHMEKLSFPECLTVLPVSFIASPVRPNLHSITESCIPFPLSVIDHTVLKLDGLSLFYDLRPVFGFGCPSLLHRRFEVGLILLGQAGTTESQIFLSRGDQHGLSVLFPLQLQVCACLISLHFLANIAIVSHNVDNLYNGCWTPSQTLLYHMKSSRLKNFCELCRKQCRDENGLHCHLNSVSHKQRVLDFANNPEEHIQKASKEFQGRFLQMVKTKYPGEAQYLEKLYGEYLQERKVIKFSNTRWRNLSQFGEHLKTVRNFQVIGQPPDCKILYAMHKTNEFIEQNNRLKLQGARQKQKQKLEQTLASRMERQQRAEQLRIAELNAKQLQLEEERKTMQVSDRLEFNIQGFGATKKRSALHTTEELEKEAELPLYKKNCGKIEEIYLKMVQLSQQREGEQDEEKEWQWILPGIIAKIKPHEIDEAFHFKKCKIVQVVQPYLAKVHVGTATITIDQEHLETVIPKPGHRVMVLEGKQRGKIGDLKEVRISDGCGLIQVEGSEVLKAFNCFSRIDENA